ncbi:MAG: bacterio-opsin activator domain-containing protein [Halorientalis sp.]
MGPQSEIAPDSIPYRQLVENACEGIAIVQDGQVVYCNERCADLFGMTDSELVGQSFLTCVDEDERAVVADRYERRVDEETIPNRYRFTTRNGRIVEITDARIEYGDRLADVVVRDVTEQDRYETALSTLNDVTQAVPRAETPEEIATRITQRGPAILGIETVSIYLRDDEGVLQPVATGGGDELADLPAIRPGDDPVWTAFVDGETAKFDAARIEEVISTGIESEHVFVVPLCTHGVLLASDAGTTAETDVFEFVETLAATTTAALDRAERETTLRRREETLTATNERLDRMEQLTALFRRLVRVSFENATRAATERAVCTAIGETGPCDFVWIGRADPPSQTLEPQATSGDDRGYVSDTILAQTAASSEPTAVAYRTGELQVVTDLHDGQEASWRGAATQRGFRTVIGVPLIYEGVRYGVLGLYSSKRRCLGTFERDLLTEIGTVVAARINAVSRVTALLAGTSSELDLEITDLDCFLYRFARDADCSLTFDGVVPEPSGENRVYVTVTDGGDTAQRFREQARQSSIVTELEYVTDDDHESQFSLVLCEPFVGTVLATHGLSLRALETSGRTATLTVSVPNTIEIQRAVAIVQDRYPSASLAAKRTTDRERTDDRQLQRVFDTLTERQRAVLEHAYDGGYFDAPKAQSGTELAASMGIASSTFHDHLSRAQRTVFESLFEGHRDRE